MILLLLSIFIAKYFYLNFFANFWFKTIDKIVFLRYNCNGNR